MVTIPTVTDSLRSMFSLRVVLSCQPLLRVKSSLRGHGLIPHCGSGPSVPLRGERNVPDLDWSVIAAPSLDDMEALADRAFAGLPESFRRLVAGVVIRVEDFPTDEVLEEMEAETPFDLLGLFQASASRRMRP